MVILTLGDLLLDVVVRLHAPLAGGGDAPATTRLGAGGQAANVAAWAAHLGADARLVAVRSRCLAGRLAAEDLESRGVRILGPVRDAGGGTVVALVDDEFERTMATDRGVAPTLTADDVRPEWIAGCDRLHLSGYALMRSPIDSAALRAAGAAAGARISVDVSSWSAVRDFGPARFRDALRAVAPHTVFANEREVDVLGGEPDAPVVVVKRGAEGCEVRWHGARYTYPASPAEVVDTTGAGDAFAAGFLTGDGPDDAARRALAAAARCVERMGAMP